jgi:hypothetical protein
LLCLLRASLVHGRPWRPSPSLECRRGAWFLDQCAASIP